LRISTFQEKSRNLPFSSCCDIGLWILGVVCNCAAFPGRLRGLLPDRG